MRISTIHATHFLGLAAVDVKAQAPVQLFCGRNRAGKSSLRDAIALALTGDLGRVSLKKEAAQLIRDGSDLAVCEITDSEGDRFQVSINRSGKINDTRTVREIDPALPLVLDAQRFARLDIDARRVFLYGLMKVKTDGPAIVQRLLKRGVAKERIDRVASLLRVGFEAACKEAKGKATEAKGAWRAVTGEVYGSEKAKTWKAHVPPYNPAELREVATAIEHAAVAIESWQKQLGTLDAQERQRNQLRSQMPALRDLVALDQRRTDKLKRDQAGLAEAQQALETARAAAGLAPRVGLVHDLARALFNVLLELPLNLEGLIGAAYDNAQGMLDSYVAEHGAILDDVGGDADAKARLPQLQRTLGLMQSAVTNSQRDYDAAQVAKSRLAEIEAELAQEHDAAAHAEATQKVDELKAQQAELQKRSDTLKSIKALIDQADEKNVKATAHAAEVTAWDELGDALAPDGIPGEILAEALGPINDRLDQAAADSTWALVRIGTDMSITVAGRDYRLLSESEKWRSDAMLAEAIAHLSGWKLVVLDRVDVLDGQARAELLTWLDTLTDLGEVDAALLFATLLELPTSLPQTVEAHWLMDGRLLSRDEYVELVLKPMEKARALAQKELEERERQAHEASRVTEAA